VVAAHARCAEFTSDGEHSSRIWSTRNEVPDEDDTVYRTGRDSSQKVLEFRGAAVYIADPNRAGHTCRIAGRRSRSASERDRPPGRLQKEKRRQDWRHSVQPGRAAVGRPEWSAENARPPCRDGPRRFTVSASIRRFRQIERGQ
jgi:hypothetical protein